MKRNTMIKILKALNSGSGVGSPMRFPLSQVVFLSGVPRMTTYRYLTDAVCLGFVETSVKKFHGMMSMHYKLTDAGRDFAGIIR